MGALGSPTQLKTHPTPYLAMTSNAHQSWKWEENEPRILGMHRLYLKNKCFIPLPTCAS